MHFHISDKTLVTSVIFSVAFIAVTLILVRKPNLVKSKNRFVRLTALFCIVFVPGVLAATVCAKALTEIYSNVFGNDNLTISEELDEDDDEDEDEKRTAE